MAARKTPVAKNPGAVKAPAAPKSGAKPKVARKAEPAVAPAPAAKIAAKPAAKPGSRSPAKPRAVKKSPPAPAVEAMTAAKGRGPDRLGMIAVAAYFRAERRGFTPGGEVEDWLEAEAEIERLLAGR
jgi:hypothetical protein